jgi:hypothetical protein
MTPRVGLVTCNVMPEEDPDRELLRDALTSGGVDARWVAWNDPQVAWGDFSIVVLRSTWDYYLDLPAFLAWVDRAAAVTTVLNPPRVVHWNTHKGYLAQLAARGIPVTPTQHVKQGSACSLATLARERGWTDVVVKPAVSAGSYHTLRASCAVERATGGRGSAEPASCAAAQQFLDGELQARDMMVQPYLRSVEDHGERSLIFIAGELTHSIRKSPRFAGGSESVTSVSIPEPESALARHILSTVPEELLYARVDLARDDNGNPLLMELELVEPSLFLAQHPPALQRLAQRVVKLASRT